MRRQLLPALGMLLVFTVLTGLIYPLLVTGIAQAAFADKADGSLDRARRRGRGLEVDRPAASPSPSTSTPARRPTATCPAPGRRRLLLRLELRAH